MCSLAFITMLQYKTEAGFRSLETQIFGPDPEIGGPAYIELGEWSGQTCLQLATVGHVPTLQTVANCRKVWPEFGSYKSLWRESCSNAEGLLTRTICGYGPFRTYTNA
jgi:hypothetical protein